MNNPILSADAYTICSDEFTSKEARSLSVYNFCNRYSPSSVWPDLAKDSRMVLFGLHKALETISRKITMEDLFLAEKFMSRSHSFGGPLSFPRHLWKRVIENYDGYLPLQITSLREGSTFFPNEPVIQVKSTGIDMGELAAHIEARLVGTVSIGTAAATLCRHWLERMREQVSIDYQLLYNKNPTAEQIDSNARFQIHNFGARACSNEEESKLIGSAHLLSFYGTDNFDAAYECYMNGAQDPIGTSIYASAHHTVLSHKTEKDSIKTIVDSTSGQSVRICSIVADCFNYNNAVDSIVRMSTENKDVIHVIRPDSGDAFSVIKRIYDICVQNEVYKEVNGYKVPSNVRFIYGDSVKPSVQLDVMSKLRLCGILPTQWGIWGVGGYIVNNSTRDTLSSAYKLCAKDSDLKPVVKLSETRTKMSVPYYNNIYRSYDHQLSTTVIPSFINEYRDGQYTANRTVYVNGINTYNKNFSYITDSSLTDFDNLKDFATKNPTFGLHREHFHSAITKVQDETFQQFRG